MGLVAALLVLGLSTSIGTASACNGNSAFCDLPLTQAGIYLGSNMRTQMCSVLSAKQT